MLTQSNLHTHTYYCDGQATPRQMVEAALAANFRSLGFSGHAFMGDAGKGWCMTEAAQQAYFAELTTLKQEYAGRIDLYAGLELDAFGTAMPAECDYAIGSCHFFKTPTGLSEIDHSPEQLHQGIDSLGGDAFAMLQRYFDTLVAFALRESFQVIGHFDLPMKFNQNNEFFDAGSARYRDLALQALDALCETGKVFEVNTGAMKRCAAPLPYPAPFLLARLLEKGAAITISSDAHTAASLTFAFDEAEALLLRLGFTTQVEWTSRGFVEVPLI